MWVGLLGSMVVRAGETPVPLSAAKQRVVLAALALRARHVLSFDELAAAVWGETPPAAARATLRNYIRRLRQSLRPDGERFIVARDPGYVLDVADEDVDVFQFTNLFRRGGEAIEAGHWAAAADQLRQALALWRDAALADVPSQQLHAEWNGPLEEMRLQALEWRISADLQIGRHELVTAELRQLTAAFPLREGLHGLLMTALYQVGRQREAVAAYEQARHVLAEDLGVMPGEQLRRLHQQILTQEPAAGVRLAGGWVVARQVPAGVAGFSGRAGELRVLEGLAGRAVGGGGAGQAVVISAIAGMAGVGKTALAVHFAHRVAGWFPDGQLYADLRGFDPDVAPVAPGLVLRGFLAALGVAADQVPGGVEEQAGLYRSLLAGRRVLVLLDNARDAEQVRPLIPGNPGTLVLITSRNHLTGLAVTHAARVMPLYPDSASGQPP